MRNILSPLQENQLRAFLETDPIFAFDFDGTLAPIVKNAGQAEVRPATRRLLSRLCRTYSCALLTGRGRDDVLPRVRGIPFVAVLGNHGAEWGGEFPGEGLMRRQTARWFETLSGALDGLQGIHLENKGLSLSIHYRKARHKQLALGRIREALDLIRGARVIGGKQVVNVLPKRLAGKGSALVRLKKHFRKSTAFFAGDDLNDEEVFELPARERVFKLKVGKTAGSRADFFISCQAEMDELLELILRLGREKRRRTAR